MVTLCAHLFDPHQLHKSLLSNENNEGVINEEGQGITCSTYSEPDRVLECMQRALKIASVINPNLFVEILDRYVISLLLFRFAIIASLHKNEIIFLICFSQLLTSTVWLIQIWKYLQSKTEYLHIMLKSYCNENRYVYFFEKNNPAIKVNYLSGLVALINEQLAGGTAEGQISPAAATHYRNTLGTKYMKKNIY